MTIVQTSGVHAPPAAAAPVPADGRRPPSPWAMREAMSLFATGVTVLTAAGETGHGMTANAFSSLSLVPPMVLCCVSRGARMHEAIVQTGAFAVSILGADQKELARYFADRRRPSGAVQFGPVGCQTGPVTGAPIINGALAWVECSLVETHEGGDHSIFIGSVLNAHRGRGTRALSFFGGEYHEVGHRRAAAAEPGPR